MEKILSAQEKLNNISFLLNLLSHAVNESSPEKIPLNIDFEFIFNFAKLHNGENGVFSDEEKAKVAISLGDILNNITNMASDLNISLDEIIALNLKKIELQNKRKNLNT